MIADPGTQADGEWSRDGWSQIPEEWTARISFSNGTCTERLRPSAV